LVQTPSDLIVHLENRTKIRAQSRYKLASTPGQHLKATNLDIRHRFKAKRNDLNLVTFSLFLC